MNIKLPTLDKTEIQPGIILIGEPTPVIGTNKLRCLANVFGCLCIIEVKIIFTKVIETEVETDGNKNEILP